MVVVYWLEGLALGQEVLGFIPALSKKYCFKILVLANTEKELVKKNSLSYDAIKGLISKVLRRKSLNFKAPSFAGNTLMER